MNTRNAGAGSGVESVIYSASPRFDMTGQRLGADLTATGKAISKTLALKLVGHAVRRLKETGFEMAAGWARSVYTMDADRTVREREYTVRFTNAKGGFVEVSGIALDSKTGTPVLDYGISAGDRP